MHPSVSQRVIDEATEREPAHAAAEYGAQFRIDVEAFVSREVVEHCSSHGVYERPPVPGISYSALATRPEGTTISSTIVARPGTSSSISLGASCPSDCANGRTSVGGVFASQ
jgi:hypothetical protein